jgi:Zn-dependent protease with chaperone function
MDETVGGFMVTRRRFVGLTPIERVAFCAAVLVYVVAPLVICMILIGRMLGTVPLWLLALIALITVLASLFFFPSIDNSFKGRSLFEHPRQQFLVAFTLLLLSVGLSVGLYAALFWGATSLDLVDQIIMIGGFGIVVVGLGVLTRNTRGRENTLKYFDQQGLPRMAIPLHLVLFGTLIIAWFSSTTFILYSRGIVDFSHPPQSPDEIMTFYIWHLIDAVPLLEITQTLRWPPPIGYQDGAVGALLLAFKIIFIVPVIALVAQYLRTSDDSGKR